MLVWIICQLLGSAGVLSFLASAYFFSDAEPMAAADYFRITAMVSVPALMIILAVSSDYAKTLAGLFFMLVPFLCGQVLSFSSYCLPRLRPSLGGFSLAPVHVRLKGGSDITA